MKWENKGKMGEDEKEMKRKIRVSKARRELMFVTTCKREEGGGE
jgi:hypothetical protein